MDPLPNHIPLPTLIEYKKAEINQTKDIRDFCQIKLETRATNILLGDPNA